MTPFSCGRERMSPWNAKQQRAASLLLDAAAGPHVRQLLFLASRERPPENDDAAADAGRRNVGDARRRGEDAPARAATSAPPAEELARRREVTSTLARLRRALEHVTETVDRVAEDHDRNSGGNDDGDVRGRSAVLAPRSRPDAAADGAGATKIALQLQGISVPLSALLRRSPPSPTLVARSARYACTAEAARALAALEGLRRRIPPAASRGDGVGDGADGDAAGTHQTPALSSLVSCAVALSSLEIASSEGSSASGGDDVWCSAGTETAEAPGGAVEALDRGEDCAAAILSCVDAVFGGADAEHDTGHGENHDDAEDGSACHKSTGGERDGALARAVGADMGGALVARLAQGCLSLLPTTAAPGGRGGGGHDAALQLRALDTLRALLVGVPLPEVWGALLPGCFAGLYRAALAHLRYASAGSAYRVAASCVDVLALLLRRALAGMHGTAPSEEAAPTAGDGANVTSEDDSVQPIVASLMAAVQSAKQQSISSVPSSSAIAGTSGNGGRDAQAPKDNENAPTNLEALKAEANRRLPGPLVALLGLASPHRHAAVRRSGLRLCRALLVDARGAWTGTAADVLGRRAFECCLAALADESEKVASCSRATLRAYRRHLGPAGWKRRLGRRVVPAVLELAEALPALARSGREASARHTLRLVEGYFVASFRHRGRAAADGAWGFDVRECLSSGGEGKEKVKSELGSALACSEAVKVVTEAFAGECLLRQLATCLRFEEPLDSPRPMPNLTELDWSRGPHEARRHASANRV